MASLKKQNKPLADDLKEKKRSMTCLAKNYQHIHAQYGHIQHGGDIQWIIS